jgi:hypothetical protein
MSKDVNIFLFMSIFGILTGGTHFLQEMKYIRFLVNYFKILFYILILTI